MRLVVWNCCNGISHKQQIDYLNSLKADVAILPELREKNIISLKPHESIWVTNNLASKKPKGLGILSFNGYQLEELERDVDMEIYIPVRVRKNDLSFNLLAIWNFYSDCKQGRFKGVKGGNGLELMAMEHYRPLFKDHSLIAGDFNFGPTFLKDEFDILSKKIEESNLSCLYKIQGKDCDRPMTFKHNNGKTRHCLDHVFGSQLFKDTIKSYEVGDLDSVVRSDHAPLILDFRIP